LDFDFSTFQKDKKIMFDFKIKEQYGSTKLLGRLLYEQDPEKWDLIKNHVGGTVVKVSYTDTYLKTPLACFMLIHTIKWFADNFNLSINELNLNLAFFDKPYPQYNSLVMQNFEKSKTRNRFITECAKEISNITPKIEEGHLPHFRELKIESENFELIIRPDGGIENGWIIDRSKDSLHDTDLKDDFKCDLKLYNKEYRNNGILYVVGWKEK